jgi:hypothetical protein
MSQEEIDPIVILSTCLRIVFIRYISYLFFKYFYRIAIPR